MCFASCTRHNFGVFYVFVTIVSVLGPYDKSSWELVSMAEDENLVLKNPYYRLRDKPKYREMNVNITPCA